MQKRVGEKQADSLRLLVAVGDHGAFESMNFGSTPLGGTMSKREPQIILKTASEAFASS